MTTARAALPWYVHPAEDPAGWDQLAQLTPRPSFVVVNVHNGPGRPDDEWYPAAVSRLRGIRLVGYVDVAYGERHPSEVLEETRTWMERYKLGGVMLDQLPSGADSTQRCADYVTAVRRAGAGFVVGNPGTVPHLGHLAMMDVTCVFEGTAAQYEDFRPNAGLSRVPRARVWHLVHTCPPEQLEAVTARTGLLGAGHAFVTDRLMPHPWGGFPLATTAGRVGPVPA